MDQFFIRGCYNKLDIYYLSQSYFDLRKITIRNNNNENFLFIQTLEDIGNKYRDVGGYDMSYDEYKQIFREPCEEEYIYLCIDRSEKRSRKILHL